MRSATSFFSAADKAPPSAAVLREAASSNSFEPIGVPFTFAMVSPMSAGLAAPSALEVALPPPPPLSQAPRSEPTNKIDANERILASRGAVRKHRDVARPEGGCHAGIPLGFPSLGPPSGRP